VRKRVIENNYMRTQMHEARSSSQEMMAGFTVTVAFHGFLVCSLTLQELTIFTSFTVNCRAPPELAQNHDMQHLTETFLRRRRSLADLCLCPTHPCFVL
jgi:hypothetical protein